MEFICQFYIFLVQVKQFLKRQGQSTKSTNEQIQKKLTENGIHRDDSSKNFPVRNVLFVFLKYIFKRLSKYLVIINEKTNIILAGYYS